jgi:hypothetical protein
MAKSPVVPTSPIQAEDLKRKHEAEDQADSRDSSTKKARTIGPTLPPANLDERPNHPVDSGEEDSSSDDDGFGPSLPTAASSGPQDQSNEGQQLTGPGSRPSQPVKSQRDEWMIVPPSSDDWSSRMDPTKLKNRKFNTGKGAKGPAVSSGRESNANWTETPDEKRARLQREVLGIKDISTAKMTSQDDAKGRENAKKLRDYNVSTSSLPGSRR